VISFLGPQRYSHSDYPLSTRLCITISDRILRLINLKSFFPEALFLGSPATSLTSAPWQTGQNLDLCLQEAPWRVMWHEAEERIFFQAKDIIEVRINYNVLDMDQHYYSRIMSIDYRYNYNNVLPGSRTLHLYFFFKSDHDLWNEVLLLFRRISPSLAYF